MIKWIDIVSPRLRDVHNVWTGFRGPQLMPSLHDYNSFVGAAGSRMPEELCASVVLPADSRGATFRQIGSRIAHLLPPCKPGQPLAETSPFERDAIVRPIQRVTASRQPECRRAQHRSGREYEMLLLPFSDGKLRVCLVHIMCEIVVGSQRAA